MAKRFVVTGGTGLIGRALVASLARDGHEVWVLSRSATPAEAPLGNRPAGPASAPNSSVHRIHWDGKTAAGWGPLVDGAEAVVNLAGESIAGESLGAIALRRWTRRVKNRILQSRLDAGRAVTEAIAAARAKPRTLLQASAIGYYGSRGDGELTEASGPGDGFTAQVCRAWEASTQAVEGLGVRRAVLRTGVVLAPEGGVLPLMALPFRLFAGGPLGNGRQFLPWIHLTDEVAAIRHLLENPDASGPFNLSSPQPVSNGDFSKTLGRALHRPAWLRTPALPLKAALGEKSEIVLASARVIPRRLLDDGFAFAFPELQGALRDLWAPRS